MQLISFLVQHYFSIKYEDFTSKLVAAFAILRVIKQDDKVDLVLDNALIELGYIEENTHPDIKVSLYKLDRNVNSSKSEVKLTQHKIQLRKNDYNPNKADSKEYETFTDDKIQYYLCKALRRVNDIVCKQIKVYSDEVKIDFEPEDTNGLTFDLVSNQSNRSEDNE